jgi:integrase
VQVTVGEAVDQYREELQSLGRSRNTIDVYMTYLRKFANSCGQHTSVASVSPEKMTKFFAGVTTPHTRNKVYVILRGWLKWCVRRKYIRPADAELALEGRKTRVVARQPKHYVPVDQFPALLDAAGEAHPVERAVVALALYTLCRQSEIIALRLRDIDPEARTIKVWRQKRQRWTEVVISPDLMTELGRWLTWYAQSQDYADFQFMMFSHPDWRVIPHFAQVNGRGDKGYHTGPTGEVIINPERDAFNLRNVVKRALTKLGAKTRNGWSVEHLGEGMHTIRRSGARALLDHLEGPMGHDRAVNMVSKMLNHDDIRATMSYIDMDIDKQRLDDFLRSNSMYGEPTGQTGYASVIMMPKAREA